MNLKKYKYIAHRGLHNEKYNILENTLESFEDAINNNYAIELDVQLTKDEKIIVFHDYNIKRMTGQDLYIKDLTLSELKKIKLKDSFSTIPTLDKVLDLVDGKVPLLIEIKNEEKVGKLEEVLNDTLSRYKGEFMLESFNPFVVRYFKKNTNYSCGLLACKHYTSFKGKILGLFINFFLSKNIFNADFVAYKFDQLNEKVYSKIMKRKLPLFLWTIDNMKDAKEALNIGEGIIFENMDPRKTSI